SLGRAYDVRLLRRLWAYVRPYRGQVVATLALVVPMFAVEVAQPFLVKRGVDGFVSRYGVVEHAPSGLDRTIEAVGLAGPIEAMLDAPFGIPPLAWLAVLYLFFAISLGLMQYLHMVLMTMTGQNAMRDLRRVVFDRIQKLHMGFFDDYPVGRLVTRTTNDVENISEMFSAGIVALVTDVAKMAGFGIVLWLESPTLAWKSFLVVPVLAIGASIFRWKVREAFRDVRVRIARINAHIQETVTGMKVVQLFSREERNLRDFDAMNAGHRDAWRRSIHYDALLFATVEAASQITIAIILWAGTGIASPGVLYFFIDLMRRFFMPLRDLSAKYSVMQSAMASAERIFQLVDTRVAIEDPAPDDVVVPAARRGEVEFDDVWFAYDDADAAAGAWVLRGVSFRVAPGEKVALVGATGAGKSTIIGLLTRLYEVQRGAVRIDGVDVRRMPQAELRRRVATVPQDVFLFSGTVAENIGLGRADVPPDAIRRAAAAVRADRFIERLPHGYDTPVRERGTNFSAGQRQLLSFARALAHGADILVLDEATSSIDTETEALVQRGIHVLMEGRTAIAIAHRLSTIEDVDRIYVLDRGRIVEQGSHRELLRSGGRYRELYELQVEAQEPAA
ncbi:MAG: ABC transporter ATP-binding protein, partial [Myxococcales bacterium]|nr:ABC transporter ATP-binding protein [Myxococcales bacterium]